LEQRLDESGMSRSAFVRRLLLAELDRLDEVDAREAKRSARAEAKKSTGATYDSNLRLPSGFNLRSGRRVLWATATVEDLEERIADLSAVHAAQVLYYKNIIEHMLEAKVKCFGELVAAEQQTLLSAA
jgi:hypothetical protein